MPVSSLFLVLILLPIFLRNIHCCQFSPSLYLAASCWPLWCDRTACPLFTFPLSDVVLFCFYHPLFFSHFPAHQYMFIPLTHTKHLSLLVTDCDSAHTLVCLIRASRGLEKQNGLSLRMPYRYRLFVTSLSLLFPFFLNKSITQALLIDLLKDKKTPCNNKCGSRFCICIWI